MIKCDFCKNNKAKYNLQKVWVLWKIDKNDNYKFVSTLDIEEPVGEENLHLCENCFREVEDHEI